MEAVCFCAIGEACSAQKLVREDEQMTSEDRRRLAARQNRTVTQTQCDVHPALLALVRLLGILVARNDQAAPRPRKGGEHG